MQAFKFSELLNRLMAAKGYGSKEITVKIPGMGAAIIDDVIWHDACDEFHVILRVREIR